MVKQISFTEFLQYQVGGQYPLEEIFNNLNQEEILEEVENYINKISSDITFTSDEEYEIDRMLDRGF